MANRQNEKKAQVIKKTFIVKKRANRDISAQM